MPYSKIFEVDSLKKSFKVGNQMVEVLKGIDFSMEMEEFLIIFGPSGCGKSTLLHAMLGLEIPTSGTVKFLGKNLYENNEDQRAEVRKQKVGMVYQQPYWIKSLNVVENVAFPLMILGKDKAKAAKDAEYYLDLVGMADWRSYYPTELSSGQQQKVSLARALINDPEVVVTDEPTGNLDTKSGEELMKIVAKINNEENKTVIMVTHDLEYLTFATRLLHMVDGKVDKEYSGNIDKEEILEIASHGKKGNNHG
jgi:putative ABC transport system ATP-binding protein